MKKAVDLLISPNMTVGHSGHTRGGLHCGKALVFFMALFRSHERVQQSGLLVRGRGREAWAGKPTHELATVNRRMATSSCLKVIKPQLKQIISKWTCFPMSSGLYLEGF